MQYGRLEEEKEQPAWRQIRSTGDLAIVISAVSMLVLVMFLPELTGKQLPDLRLLDPQDRKTEFFAFLEPIVDEVRADIREERGFIASAIDVVESGEDLSWFEQRRIGRLARRYEVPIGDSALVTDVLPTLMRRIDLVPKSLVFVQAAKESGWGTSRFAIQGNNLFGQRCYSAGCGITPAGVRQGAKFGVASFHSVDASVASYFRNLNTHPEYLEFRRDRQSLRDAGTTLDGMTLAESLDNYSERGDDYVAELKALIKQNSLDDYD